MMDWQPIETADMDNLVNPVLATGKFAHITQDWPAPHYAVVKYSEFWQEWLDALGNRFIPTHWMPLPDPPKETP